MAVTEPTQSARAIIDKALGEYGLASLSAWAWQKWQQGTSIDQIMLELRETPEYKTRYPAMAALSKQGRAITEQQYVDYERDVAAIFKAAGLPQGFYDSPDDFARFLTNDVSAVEVQKRVEAYQDVAFSAPPEVRQAWRDVYGLSDGDLTAFFINPDLAEPLINKKYNAATAAGWSNRTGFGNLNQAQAEMVGDLGLSTEQVAGQFGELSALGGLFDPLVGQNEEQIGTDTALGAAFGKNAQDQAIIEARKQRRLNEFQGGGGVATTQTGATGAGSAR